MKKRCLTACMRNSGFSGKTMVSAFFKSQCQTESEVIFNPLLLIHAKRYASPYETTVLTLNRQKNEHKYIQDRKASRTFSTFGFARHTSQPFANPKELNFSPHK